MTLKRTLDRLYKEYDFQGRIAHDPIEFPHRYQRPADIEVSGFIASCLAYGRVDLFKPVVAKILVVMGESPADFLLHFSPKKQASLFSGIKYRFNENEDILCLLYALHKVLNTQGSIEAAFMEQYSPDDHDTGSGLKGLVETMLRIDTKPVCGRNIKTPGFLQFIPSPVKGSGCKRMNLFLRWMVRDKDIDFGIWKGIPKNRLVIPLDT
ncbi:MAG: TIGR02757 family protein, partial [Thermodesulfovibrionales bacterium]